jgi:hypothetical protein
MSQEFKYRVNLTHIPSNQTVEFDDTWGYPDYIRGEDWETDPVFIWTDGNYGCDCNRHIFFNKDGLNNINYEDVECGEKLYRLNWIKNLETGKVIFKGEIE